jgi:hypothetical protein
MIHKHLKLCRDLGLTVPVQHIIVRCPRRGTMWLHTLRGMKVEVMCIAFMKYINNVISSYHY